MDGSCFISLFDGWIIKMRQKDSDRGEQEGKGMVLTFQEGSRIRIEGAELTFWGVGEA